MIFYGLNRTVWTSGTCPKISLCADKFNYEKEDLN